MPSRRIHGFVALGALALTPGLLSCGNGNERPDGLPAVTTGQLAACPNDLPDACPEGGPPPTYDADVGPLIDRYCVSCHSPGGAAPDHLFDNYERLRDNHKTGPNDVYKQIYTCRMPPVILPQPTLAERETILNWYVCGLPKN